MQAIKISKVVKKNQRGIMKKNFVLTFIEPLTIGGLMGSIAAAALPAFLAVHQVQNPGDRNAWRRIRRLR
jgi:uncharacterized membrane protein